MEQFEIFWKAYPKKVAKGDARKAWMQTQHLRPDLDVLLEAIGQHCQSEQWRKDNGRFIPHPATWLRQERWHDVLEVQLPGVVNGRAWHETAQGIEAKGKELGLDIADYPHFPAFKDAVIKAVMVA